MKEANPEHGTKGEN